MSMPRTTAITCTGCGAAAEFVAWESLNVSLNPEKKEPLLKGELTRFTCEKCGWSGHVIHPLLYHDMQRRFMVWWIPDPDKTDVARAGFQQPMPDYRLRCVTNLNELKEKIYLFDEDLDDRHIEVLKLIIELRSAQTEDPVTGPLLYSEKGLTEDNQPAIRFAHLGSGGITTLTVSSRALADVAETLKDKLPAETDCDGTWPVVDRKFAMEIMKSIGREAGPGN